MSFVFPKSARTYFRAFEQRKWALLFDPYYLCLTVGLDTRRLGKVEDTEGTKFIDTYPAEYSSQAELIAGLLIDAELDRKAIRPEDRGAIERAMLDLLNTRSPTYLSPHGAQQLNLYAAGGFLIVRDAIPQPQSLEDFLIAYHQLWATPPA